MDLLVLGPSGFFVVEVKSRPGSISGDAGGWVWRFEKKVHHVDNPVFLTNLKAKRLKTLLQNGKDVDPRDVPWVEPVVFCSAPSLDVKLPPEARARVFGREPEEGRPGSGLPGVVAELT
ncbi:MAG: NERD domain-containing protein, partial [Acidobacteria bacterium ACB2]|nr:NERD domain-containing protein [Acidobacteria bacterium ACB2]